jgi:DNA-binding MarR family transcriptional regulator
VTIGQMHCMRVIGRLGDPTMSELAEVLRLHPSTVTTLVDALVERGLIDRRDDTGDRRIVRVGLTDKGKRRRAKHREAMRARLRELMGDISDEELREIHRALTALRDAAAQSTEDQGAQATERESGGERAASKER